jgi:hypothetical protein
MHEIRMMLERDYGLSRPTTAGGAPNFDFLKVGGVDIGYEETIETDLTAYAGGGQGSAVLLGLQRFHRVTVCAANADSVKLRDTASGAVTSVQNDGAKTLAVYPFLGESINALSANAPVYIAPGYSMEFRSDTNTHWVTKTFATRVLNVSPFMFREIAFAPLTGAGAAGTFSIATGVGLAALLGAISNGAPAADDETSAAFAMLQVPWDYTPGQAFTVRCRAKLKGAGATAAPTIGVSLYTQDDDGVASGELNGTAALALTGSLANKDFVIDPATLTPGKRFFLGISTFVDNTNSTDVQSEISNVEIRYASNANS